MAKQQGNADVVAVVNAGEDASASAAEVATTGRTVMPEPEGGWPTDEFTGKAGSYVRDPYTGLRSPASDLA